MVQPGAPPPGGLRLGPSARGVAEARRYAVDVAARLGADDDTRETVRTLVSELVTNALLHAGTDVVVRVDDARAALRVSVTDGSPAQPLQRRLGPGSTTGRGLRLLRALSTDSGTERSDAIGAGGKTVWFTVSKRATEHDRQAVDRTADEVFAVDHEQAW